MLKFSKLFILFQLTCAVAIAQVNPEKIADSLYVAGIT
jgi:hypothetical protein